MLHRLMVGAALALVLLLALPAAAVAGVEISKIQFDPPGSDSGSNNSLNAEYVVIKNTGNRAVTLTGWTLRDTDRHGYKFPTFRLGAGRVVTVHTGSGDDTRKHLYWALDNYVWNNDGDTAILKNASGNRIGKCRYTGSGSSVSC